MSKTESNVATATAPGTTTGPALEIKDTRTGTGYTVPILEKGTEGDTAIRAMDLRQIKTAPDEFGLMTYDPAFMNTASCKSAITFIDGDKGILRYRGYPIEQLAEKATLPRGRLAAAPRRAAARRTSTTSGCTTSRTTRTCTRTSRRSCRASATTRIRCRCSAARSRRCRRSIRRRRTSTIRTQRNISIVRLLAKLPTLAAFCYPPREGPAVHLSRQRSRATSRTSSRWSRGCRSRSTRRIRCS